MSEYQTITPDDNRALSDFLVRNGQFLMPMVRLIEDARAAVARVTEVETQKAIAAAEQIIPRPINSAIFFMLTSSIIS